VKSTTTTKTEMLSAGSRNPEVLHTIAPVARPPGSLNATAIQPKPTKNLKVHTASLGSAVSDTMPKTGLHARFKPHGIPLDVACLHQLE
jgi:hypothetical protein